MDGERFNQLFNRYAHIQLAETPKPYSPQADVIQLPIDVFQPVRNIRRVLLATSQPGICSLGSDGIVERVTAEGGTLIIKGWTPWKAESSEQGIRVLSGRPLLSGQLLTSRRPDIAERFQNYGFEKSGFELRISSADGKPIHPEAVALVAFGTNFGEIRLSCCGCP
jgi:hypothetical protein